jgi:FkbM family methyltransferase
MNEMQHAVYIGNNQLFVKTVWGGMLYVHAHDKSVTPSLLFHGFFEPGLTKWMLQNIKKGMKVIDVGANIGYHSVLMALLLNGEGKLIAYEADPDNYRLLRHNLSVQNLDIVSETHDKAAYSKQGTVTFYQTEHFLGNGSLNPATTEVRNRFKIEQYRKLDVEAVPLDIHFNQTDVFDVVKIDVEGAELHVFHGMKQLIGNKRIRSIVFELNKEMMPESQWNELLRILMDYQEQLPVRFYRIEQDGTQLPMPLEQIFKTEYIADVLMKIGE